MQMTMIEALNSALSLELERDKRVVLLGQDIGVNGGVFRVTEHLQKKFGERRVFDTPLAESSIIGSSVGMAVYGLRPIAEIQFAGFLFVCMNQLASQAARIRFRSGGAYTCPLVVRSPYGGGVRTPELHSDSVEGLFLQAPGFKVVIPSNPYDAKGLLASAVADPDPVLFLENIKLYRSFRQDTPEEHYTIPLGQAKAVQEGEDVSVFAYGAMVPVALDAAKKAQQESGTSIEVIDLRTIWPLDETAIVASVEKTGRAVVVHEAPRAGGVGAEVIAIINEHCLYSLLKPIERVTGYDTPFPVPGLEDYYVPTSAKVLDAIKRVMEP
ncbi:pyruvate dehydrogenase E1 component subunit beta [Reticulibacter mediterranei]|uniref:Pyruvate dehydrogenase E1 component subunit beta n=1 Tax=Reticulibacter mediterranei TaxID=2778369 RepID=A0A8J3N1T9_9CHLR|nr:alpha-ketoacid dehydrogenase subunit beta [Reticulibacter mediterranei]GHO94552.1 pyruvate dehydrogenase E1 component subunit beta [Reticulibacter mediterranei]